MKNGKLHSGNRQLVLVSNRQYKDNQEYAIGQSVFLSQMRSQKIDKIVMNKCRGGDSERGKVTHRNEAEIFEKRKEKFVLDLWTNKCHR